MSRIHASGIGIARSNRLKTMIFAVLPLKPFADAKSRLGSVLSAGQRGALARAMAADVLAALQAVPAIFRILIVSNEPDIAALAPGARAICMRDSAVTAGSGLNAVADGAARYLSAAGAEAMLLVPGDLPRLDPADIAGFIAAWRAVAGPPRLALVPAHAGGGTNLLLAGPPDAIPFSYGQDSFAAHRHAARRRGCAYATMHLDNAGADVDEPDDFHALAGQRGLGRATAALLREFGVTPRLPA